MFSFDKLHCLTICSMHQLISIIFLAHIANTSLFLSHGLHARYCLCHHSYILISSIVSIHSGVNCVYPEDHHWPVTSSPSSYMLVFQLDTYQAFLSIRVILSPNTFYLRPEPYQQLLLGSLEFYPSLMYGIVLSDSIAEPIPYPEPITVIKCRRMVQSNSDGYIFEVRLYNCTI